MKAWHFIAADRKLRYNDNRIVIDGETIKHDGHVKLCHKGLHFSINVLDALQYAPGLIACYVEVDDTSVLGNDKGVSTTRTVIKSIDATEIVVKFAILQAKQVYKNSKWNTWADNWLSGLDRTRAASYAAADAAASKASYAASNAYAAAAAAADAAAASDASYAANAVSYAVANVAANAANIRQIQNTLLETMLLDAMGISK